MSNALNRLNQTLDARGQDLGLLALRVLVGFNFLFHGAPKLINVSATAEWFASLGIPFAGANAVLAGVTEVLGGLALIAGVFLRPVSLALAGTMVVAILSFHIGNGYSFDKNGIEYPLLMLVASLALGAAGPGRYVPAFARRNAPAQ